MQRNRTFRVIGFSRSQVGSGFRGQGLQDREDRAEAVDLVQAGHAVAEALDPEVAAGLQQCPAQEHEARVNRQRLLLRRLGAPVVVTSADLLEKALLSEYESLRRSRRV